MAGGTGGHIFPGLAIAEALKQQGWDVHWLGTADRMESRIVPEHGYPLHTITVSGVRGNGFKRLLKTPLMLLKAVTQVRKLLAELKPDAVLGMGGYASGPGGLAAKMANIPLYVHEQNAVFGMTNRFLSKIATRVFTGFDYAQPQYTFTGNPVRQGLLAVTPLAQPITGTVLIVGGSLGAQVFNQQLPNLLKGLGITAITHQCGQNNHTVVEAAYSEADYQDTQLTVCEFIDDMTAAYQAHEVIICRAGALTVSEVAATGRVAIFVPLPHAVDDHQTKNAESLSRAGAAITVAQTQLAQVRDELAQLLQQPEQVVKMAQLAKEQARGDATHTICDVICREVA
jgi:UDP-N-acetylglucosamine--N-acetylmuramyl-(pentapeptide) pyrophosphoryl-undecaprenol N-acetylglucosamine transferase